MVMLLISGYVTHFWLAMIGGDRGTTAVRMDRRSGERSEATE